MSGWEDNAEKVYFDEIDCCSSYQAGRIIELLEAILIALGGKIEDDNQITEDVNNG